MAPASIATLTAWDLQKTVFRAHHLSGVWQAAALVREFRLGEILYILHHSSVFGIQHSQEALASLFVQSADAEAKYCERADDPAVTYSYVHKSATV